MRLRARQRAAGQMGVDRIRRRQRKGGVERLEDAAIAGEVGFALTDGLAPMPHGAGVQSPR